MTEYDPRALIEELRSIAASEALREYMVDEDREAILRAVTMLESRLPTEDEREALMQIIAAADGQKTDCMDPHTLWFMYGKQADAILAAGFRRAPVPPEVDERLIDDVRFARGSYPLDSETVALLDRVLVALAAVPPVTAPSRHQIAEQVRRHCTPSVEAYEAGGDRLIASVADWIENPPEWVPPVTEETVILRAQIKEAREAWWSGTEQGDNGLVYTDQIEAAMDAIWNAIGQADWEPVTEETVEPVGNPEQFETVTTVEELDALPHGVVVRADDGLIFERAGWARVYPWRTPNSTHDFSAEQIALPARVLFRPISEEENR